MLAFALRVSIAKIWVSWGQARDCALSPSEFPAPGIVPSTQSEPSKFFPSE